MREAVTRGLACGPAVPPTSFICDSISNFSGELWPAGLVRWPGMGAEGYRRIEGIGVKRVQ